ncbi:hypothetical protein BJY01DRAFT_36934 [Aspergillus pseudoustus]|uniref:Uncharacterized protein n=1 Tax=Aspergillus pseudoustus TaxID=1810923 RepID=A0ABR4KSY6_9EURO
MPPWLLLRTFRDRGILHTVLSVLCLSTFFLKHEGKVFRDETILKIASSYVTKLLGRSHASNLRLLEKACKARESLFYLTAGIRSEAHSDSAPLNREYAVRYPNMVPFCSQSILGKPNTNLISNLFAVYVPLGQNGIAHRPYDSRYPWRKSRKGGTANAQRLIIALFIGSASRNLGYERAKASFS